MVGSSEHGDGPFDPRQYDKYLRLAEQALALQEGLCYKELEEVRG
jgi:hypothetical protein